MRERSEKHRVGLYLKKEYKECLQFFKIWEEYLEVQAPKFSLQGMEMAKNLLEYHRLLLFEGACFTEKDAENVYSFLKGVNMHKDSTVKIQMNSKKIGMKNTGELVKLRPEEISFLGLLQGFYKYKCILEGEFTEDTIDFKGGITTIIKKVT